MKINSFFNLKFFRILILIKPTYTALPRNIYYWWNFGSLLGICLIIQIITGFFLTIFYENNIEERFNRINQIERNINIGWLIRSYHANGASIFFILVYLHIGRGLYYKSFWLKKLWIRGTLILLILFITAFIGYVLPWGQIRYWGATVITNLLSSIPYIGKSLTLWLWGNFSVNKSTLIRFFRFHFIFPLILLMLSIIHIIILHSYGSSNPLGFNSNIDKTPFQPYFSWKDLIGILRCLRIFIIMSLIYPNYFIDPDNFTPANPLNTPPHIQPEWYFLFAYAILRTIPNKLGGVLALIISILVLILLPMSIILTNSKNIINNKIIKKIIFFIWINNFIFLTIIGAMPIEAPFDYLSRINRLIYFILYLFII